MTTTVLNSLEASLRNGLALSHLEIINESHMHHVPPNSETHFKVVAVSDEFENKRSVARHQIIYKLVADQLEGPVHALALHTYTPAEWDSLKQVPESPNCAGG